MKNNLKHHDRCYYFFIFNGGVHRCLLNYSYIIFLLKYFKIKNKTKTTVIKLLSSKVPSVSLQTFPTLFVKKKKK